MKSLSAVLGLLLMSAAASMATPLTLKLDDGSNPVVTVTDDGAGDSNLVNGAVTWIGTLGVWTVNVSTGIGFPLQGSLSWPYLDLNSINVSNAAGTLTLTLTQGGFTAPPPPGFLFQIGGTTQGTVNAAACVDAVISTCNDAVLGPFLGGAFSGVTSFVKPLQNGTYEVGIQIVLTHGGAATSSFDAELTGIPEPGTYALIGAGLLGLGLLRRRMS
jgi:hypothetical protein